MHPLSSHPTSPWVHFPPAVAVSQGPLGPLRQVARSGGILFVTAEGVAMLRAPSEGPGMLPPTPHMQASPPRQTIRPQRQLCQNRETLVERAHLCTFPSSRSVPATLDPPPHPGSAPPRALQHTGHLCL